VTVSLPINTLGEPSITCASQLVLSPTREAGWPLMLTLSDPYAICMLGPSLLQTAWLLVASAAGLPLMKTLGEPVTILPLGSGYRHRHAVARNIDRGENVHHRPEAL
jgi:hypothetical protein